VAAGSIVARPILFVHQSDDLYGSGRCLLEIVRRLPERYRAIVVLPADVPANGPLSHALRAAGVDVRRADMAVLRRASLRPRHLPRLAWRFARGTWQVARLIRREGVALVHSNTLAVLPGALAAAVTRRPHLWHVHEVIADEPRPIRVAYQALLIILPGHIVAISRAAARSVAGRGRRLAARTSVIPDGIDVPAVHADRRARDHAQVRLAIVGRLAPRKGIAEGLQAAARLRDRGLAFHLHLYGSPPPGQAWRAADYRRLCGELGLDELVTFEGFVYDVIPRLAAADILIVPSQRPEGFGLVVLEGMAAGCAVVVTRNGGGSDEILDDGVTGLYCARDPESIAVAVERLIRDPHLRETLGHNGAIAVRSRFTAERCARELVDCYDRLVGVRGATQSARRIV
jgi:glycosyltransferase involved in cell wall biosynthesis